MKFDRKQQPPTTFAEALLGDVNWLPERSEARGSAEKLTEKAVVLESFTRFAEEKLQESPTKELDFPGGSLRLREQPLAAAFSPVCRDFADWQQSYRRLFGEVATKLLLEGREQPSVLFVIESLKDEQVLADPHKVVRDEFLLCFEPAVAALFEKMVAAMKLAAGEYALTSLGTRDNQQLLEEIYWRQPKFVVPLGAQSMQFLLGAKERLASIHGKFFPLLALEPKAIIVCPLFHPSVIATNVNMKKSTWVDMQKIMASLGKA